MDVVIGSFVCTSSNKCKDYLYDPFKNVRSFSLFKKNILLHNKCFNDFDCTYTCRSGVGLPWDEYSPMSSEFLGRCLATETSVLI